MIYESKIKCKECGQVKSETHKNIFYKCFTCNIDLCPLCKNKHNKDHIIVNYEIKNYVCHMHGKSYNSYCEDCEKNVCSNCDINHNKEHNFIYYREIIKNKKKDNSTELKQIIDRFRSELEGYIDKFKNSNVNPYVSDSRNFILPTYVNGFKNLRSSGTDFDNYVLSYANRKTIFNLPDYFKIREMKNDVSLYASAGTSSGLGVYYDHNILNTIHPEFYTNTTYILEVKLKT